MQRLAFIVLAVAVAVFIPAKAGDDPCSFKGYKPGMTITRDQLKDRSRFTPVKPKVYRPRRAKFYLCLDVHSPHYKQYIRVSGGEVVQVVREYAGEDVNRLIAALNSKYGDPAAGSLMPKVKTSFNPLWGKVKTQNSLLWVDDECGYDLELIAEQAFTAFTYGGGTSDRADLVISVSASEPGDAQDGETHDGLLD